MKLSPDQAIGALERAPRKWRPLASRIPGIDRGSCRRCRRHDAVGGEGLGRSLGGPLRRMGRRRPGGDRQARLPAIHRQIRPKGRSGNLWRRKRDHHQDQDGQGRRLSDRPFVRRELLHQVCAGRIQLGDQRGQHSEHGKRAAGHDRTVPQDHAEALGGSLRLWDDRHRIQHHRDLARRGEGEGRQSVWQIPNMPARSAAMPI